MKVDEKTYILERGVMREQSMWDLNCETGETIYFNWNRWATAYILRCGVWSEKCHTGWPEKETPTELSLNRTIIDVTLRHA